MKLQPSTALLNRPEAAGILNVSVRTTDAIIAAGELPVVRIGKSVRIRPAELDRFIAAREGYGPATPRKKQTISTSL